ncbi:hypothetical protein SF23_12410 [Streptomyces sp. MBRL 10]|nr:hypothetical protein SF23_12410 [Streptomyces sp. MBRL 10]
MLLAMCDRASSPFAWVEFSAHCWFCGLDRTLTSWTPMLARTATRDWALTFAGRPTQSLFREPWMALSCGLWSPRVSWLP